jgi:predicted small secreted protein
MKVLVAVVFLLVLGACNTMEGLGKDFQAAGRALTGSAREIQQ